MGDRSRIEWTNATWNPLSGCTKVSSGCKFCYAERQFARFYGSREAGRGNGVLPTRAARVFTDVVCHPERLNIPLRWKRPRRIFVCSMSDLFHEAVPSDFIGRVWSLMLSCPQHTFQVLTKRPNRMRDHVLCFEHEVADKGLREPTNVWLGVSCENQATADERIPLLLQTPAAVRWVSVEPMLGPIDLESYPSTSCPTGWLDDGGLDWVVCGGESGPKRRYCDNAWVRAVVSQCRSVGVPVFVKQLHVTEAHSKRGFRVSHNPSEWPDDLRVREFPNA